MSFLISPAYADTGAQAGQQASFVTFMLPLALAVFMYFMLIRPQNKRAKEQAALLTALQKGDEVVFAGGLLGRVTRLDENFVAVELKDGLEIKIQRSSISATLPKGTLKSI